MKRKTKKGLKSMIGDALMMITVSATKKCIERMEWKTKNGVMDEAEAGRKLTTLAIIYHLAGLFYNE
jgi:hypothetical protein